MQRGRGTVGLWGAGAALWCRCPGGESEMEMPAVLEISVMGQPMVAGAGIGCWGWQQSTATGLVAGDGATFNPPAAEYL
ncbi:MAG: hypothetical protein MUC60_10530 [Oscillatoria sp. Prado101]|nr:hypothetical protein [Oscillatoria sp. Prado101]